MCACVHASGQHEEVVDARRSQLRAEILPAVLLLQTAKTLIATCLPCYVLLYFAFSCFVFSCLYFALSCSFALILFCPYLLSFSFGFAYFCIHLFAGWLGLFESAAQLTVFGLLA